jgi:hypothetical protein
VKRTRAWLVVSPVIAGGVLVAHTLAYRVTSASSEPFHEYLAHAPQVLLLLALAGLAIGGFGARREAPPAWAFPLSAVATFVAQEHLERLVHGGGTPFLLATPVFLVGLSLQLPVALVAWALARRLLAVVAEDDVQPPLRSRLELDVRSSELDDVAAIAFARPLSRGPPAPVLAR